MLNEKLAKLAEFLTFSSKISEIYNPIRLLDVSTAFLYSKAAF